MSLPSLADAGWLRTPELAAVMAALGGAEGTTRVVGGAVRNALMGLPVEDIDLATRLTPDRVSERAEAAGLKVVPTGIDHGTVTVVARGTPFEVTTLRADVETFGRRARVAFTDDWEADAARRDFTMNALYCAADGTLFDPVGGLADIASRSVRFIGDADARIAEDYLRILRFFRFFAHYGDGRPDGDGLRACVRGKDGLAQLSAERVWMELKRLLAATDPGRALLWMRTADILRRILPETVDTDAIAGLVAFEAAQRLAPDPLLRLLALIDLRPGTIDGLAGRLKLSRREHRRLADAAAAPAPAADWNPVPEKGPLGPALYRHGGDAVRDRLALAAARAHVAGEAEAGFAALFSATRTWAVPEFPLAAGDLLAAGHQPGPELGALLKRLEEAWIASGFALDKDTLLTAAKGPEADGD